jgi:branched-chain amino acid transport system ATP-binding protein
VLRDLHMRVEAGQVAVVLGANGAGKTTTLRAISGMIRTSGHISFDGQPLKGKRPDLVARLGIAHVPQGRGTFTELTVEENLRLGANTRRDDGIEADLDRWYSVFPPLASRRRQQAGSMSGGEQQMLALARAMMSRPRLLLLDEPSLGLAPIVTRELFRILEQIARDEDITVLIVEQNANLVLKFANYAYVLESGRVGLDGDAEQVQADEGVRRSYLGV